MRKPSPSAANETGFIDLAFDSRRTLVSNRRKIFLALADATASAPALTVEALQANPVVPGVSIISEGPAKGHSAFDESTSQMVPVWIDNLTLSGVATCAAQYAKGLRVNVSHFTGVLEACGYLTGFAVDGPKLRGTLNLFRSFSDFAHLLELIVTLPDTFGLSIDFEGVPEIRDGKAFARCETIYSCDLVPTPAANEGGLFSADFPPHVIAALRRFFDTQTKPTTHKMDPTPDPAPTPTPKPNPALTPEQQTEAITQAVSAAVTKELEPIKTELSALTQKVAALEAANTADPGADVAEGQAAAPAPMRAIRKELNALKSSFADQGQKLSRRLGLEFAARAGANPVDHPAPDPANPTGDQRKSFEIPQREKNARAAAALLGLK